MLCDPYRGGVLAKACWVIVVGVSIAPALRMANGRLRPNIISTPIVRAVEHMVLIKKFANNTWPRGILRVYVYGEIARERLAVNIASGCRG